jgi:hypothetical protein
MDDAFLLRSPQITSPALVSGLAAKFAKDVVASKAYKEQQQALGIRYWLSTLPFF